MPAAEKPIKVEETATRAEPLYVSRIVVEKLFGTYNYDLATEPESPDRSKLLILYGENGTGKTTILWMLFHLLNRERKGGHRTYLARVRFKRFVVHLGTEIEIAAERDEPVFGSYTISITKAGKRTELLLVSDEDFRIKAANKEEDAAIEAFLELLPEVELVFLPDTRRTIPLPDPEEDVDEGLAAKTEPLRKKESAPEIALRRVLRWISKQALVSSNEGQVNVNAVYADIAKRVASTRTKSSEPVVKAEDLIATLEEQARQTQEFSKYGLTPEFAVESIVESVYRSRGSKPRLRILEQILRPYIDGNAARLNALRDTQHTIEAFVDSLKSFFVGKSLTFDVHTGLRIIAPTSRRLHPRVLSSGEKELLLLFCNVIIAKRVETLFIIDEPELSLNVIWQRKLIDALLKLSATSRMQFLLATHSIELISQRRSNVARLPTPAADF